MDKKSLGGAYALAFVGLFFGVLGAHRYYLKHRLRGTLMSALFLTGVLLIAYKYISLYAGIINEAVAMLSALDGAQTDLSQIQLFNKEALAPDAKLQIGIILCAVGFVWWLADLFVLPSAVKKYNQGVDWRISAMKESAARVV